MLIAIARGYGSNRAARYTDTITVKVQGTPITTPVSELRIVADRNGRMTLSKIMYSTAKTNTVGTSMTLILEFDEVRRIMAAYEITMRDGSYDHFDNGPIILPEDK